jgi:ribosomal protein L29
VSKRQQNVQTIRDLPDNELTLALDRARDEYFRLKLGQHTNQVENTNSIRAKRREIARIQTVITGRKLKIEAQATAGAAGKDR